MQKQLSHNILKICALSKYRTTPREVFNDLIQLTFNAAVSQEFLDDSFKASTVWYDERMRNELSTYRAEPKCWGLINACHAQWLYLVMSAEPFEDVLGSLYDTHLGKVLGQFLTPRAVATSLAQMTMRQENDQPAKVVRMGDPCGCGAGSMLLGGLRTFREVSGDRQLLDVEVMGVDIDPHMVRLTVCQIMLSAALHGMPIGSLKVYCADAIKEYMKPNTLAFSFLSRHSIVGAEYLAHASMKAFDTAQSLKVAA